MGNLNSSWFPPPLPQLEPAERMRHADMCALSTDQAASPRMPSKYAVGRSFAGGAVLCFRVRCAATNEGRSSRRSEPICPNVNVKRRGVGLS